MQLRNKKCCAVILAVMLLCTGIPLESLADEAGQPEIQTKESEIQADEQKIQTEQPEIQTDRQESGPGTDEEFLQSLEQIPDISSETPVEDQIIIVYEEAGEDNVENLNLSEDMIAEGESLGDTVDVLTLEESVDTDSLIKELESKPQVAAVSRNEIRELDELPNDPYIIGKEGWHFTAIGADATWDQVTYTGTVKVAVIDSGIDMTHPELQGQCEIGYDYVENSSSHMEDEMGHGTAIGGIIAALPDNGVGVSGIAGTAPVKLVAYRAGGTSENNGLKESYIVAALEDIAARDDIQVVNMSFGGDTLNAAEQAAVKKVRESGKILVSSAGNEGDTSYSYPASLDGVISVGAINEDNVCAEFSNQNSEVDLCAPGVSISSTDTMKGYQIVSGTSFSAPMVSAAAAVLKCANDKLTSENIEDILKKTAKDLGEAGKDNAYGYGLLQMKEALELAYDMEEVPKVSYQTHIQSIGWQDSVSDGDISGTFGQALRLEGIKIHLDSNTGYGGITYRTHVQSYGWQDYVSDGAVSGTTGQSKRFEAIQIRLTGRLADRYDVYYRVHCQTYGWLDWAKNGEAAGTEGLSKRLEAIQTVIVRKGEAAPGKTTSSFRSVYTLGNVRYRTHVQSYGWQSYVNDGKESGTTGQSKRLEAINISLSPNLPGGIEYSTHVQTYGWQDYVSDGALSGTTGRSKRLEAIRIRLTGEAAEQYDIYYQVHCQKFGWTGWAKNGEPAGSAGYGYRMEAIRIQIVKKGSTPPGTTGNTYWEK